MQPQRIGDWRALRRGQGLQAVAEGVQAGRRREQRRRADGEHRVQVRDIGDEVMIGEKELPFALVILHHRHVGRLRARPGGGEGADVRRLLPAQHLKPW